MSLEPGKQYNGMQKRIRRNSNDFCISYIDKNEDIKMLFVRSVLEIIMKAYLYNFDPIKPPFYIVKLGFTGVYIIFLISAQNIDCGYSLEPPLTNTHNLCFEQK